MLGSVLLLLLVPDVALPAFVCNLVFVTSLEAAVKAAEIRTPHIQSNGTMTSHVTKSAP